MIFLLLVFAIGILLGLLLRNKEREFKGDAPLNSSVILMIFFMGASIGSSEAIRESALSIGIQSLVFLMFTVAGSISFAYLWGRWASD